MNTVLNLIAIPFRLAIALAFARGLNRWWNTAPTPKHIGRHRAGRRS